MTAHAADSADALDWSVVPRPAMAPELYDEVVAFCTCAYEEDFSVLMPTLQGSVHVLGRRSGRLVTHAAWVTRWLQPGGSATLRAAYIEAVATDPDCRLRGHASEVMRRIGAEVRDFDLAALSPSDPAWYARLGWELWRGPLSIRTGTGLLATPGEEGQVMVLRLPRTPLLDLDAPLSAEWREGELW